MLQKMASTGSERNRVDALRSPDTALRYIICSKRRMRSSVGGCVENQLALALAFFFVGSEMYSAAHVADAARTGSGASVIFRSADAKAFGLRHSSAPVASAKYSRLREMASCTSVAMIGANTSRSSATT